jgi:hypothetical protein
MVSSCGGDSLRGREEPPFIGGCVRRENSRLGPKGMCWLGGGPAAAGAAASRLGTGCGAGLAGSGTWRGVLSPRD